MGRDDFPTGEDGPKAYQQVTGNVNYRPDGPERHESLGLGNTVRPANYDG